MKSGQHSIWGTPGGFIGCRRGYTFTHTPPTLRFLLWTATPASRFPPKKNLKLHRHYNSVTLIPMATIKTKTKINKHHALEIEEDFMLSEIAKTREAKTVKWISHQNAWRGTK